MVDSLIMPSVLIASKDSRDSSNSPFAFAQSRSGSS